MAIRCPYCNFLIELQGVRPGRFTPACSRCKQKFLLTVHEDNAPPDVAKIKGQGETSTAAVTQAPATATAPPPRGAKPTHSMGGLSTDSPITLTSSAPTPATPDVDITLPKRLGGYELTERLGKGGMGSVYLARQISLDRDVAVKVMNPQWAANPDFVARFTREAYAAAQLTHHHIVQIHDIGSEGDLNYFSMEYVDGKPLSSVVQTTGKLDVEEAAGYVLQAARGLKFAHDQGMIHRDIKPENLLINSQGVVKVADLGLVKTPTSRDEESSSPPLGGRPGGGPDHEGRQMAPLPASPKGEGARPISKLAQSSDASVTQADISMGTPAYMAPEQAMDAAKVDQRADIYSLGCTLYDLVTGRPPFEGKTVYEVLTKHASEQMTPPDLIVKRVPKTLSVIVQKMTAKKPEERYQNLGEVIGALEDFLGIDSTGPFTPREEHATALEQAVHTFNRSPKAKLRGWLVLGFYALCVALVAAAWLMNRPLLAGGFVGLAVLTSFCYFAITGVTQRTFIFRKFRQFVFGSSWGDWGMALLGAAILVVVLIVFNLHWVWLGFLIASFGLALGFHVVIDTLVKKERKPALDGAEAMLKQMRLRGLDEDALRQFVCKYAGKHWEAFYEALFGYEAKLEARQRWGRGERGKRRPRHGAWREPIIAAIDARMKKRQEQKERDHLRKIEEKRLRATGAGEAEAKQKADKTAQTMVGNAAAMRETLAPGPGNATYAVGKAAPRQGLSASMVAVMSDDDSDAKHRDKARAKWGRSHDGPANLVLGSRARFVFGAILLAGCLMWMHQNGLIPGREKVASLDDARTAASSLAGTDTASTIPLSVPLLPGALTGLFDSFLPGLAGLLLVVSAIFRGPMIGLFIIPAALLMWLGPVLGIPALGPLNAQLVSFVLGASLAAVGFVFARA